MTSQIMVKLFDGWVGLPENLPLRDQKEIAQRLVLMEAKTKQDPWGLTRQYELGLLLYDNPPNSAVLSLGIYDLEGAEKS